MSKMGWFAAVRGQLVTMCLSCAVFEI